MFYRDIVPFNSNIKIARYEYSQRAITLYGSIAFSLNRNAVALYFRFSALAGAQDNVDVIVFCFRHISVVEFVFTSDLDDFEAFGYHKGRELPEFLEKSVGVHDDRKVFGRVICCNSEIVCHC